jgi:hypothetical protein
MFLLIRKYFSLWYVPQRVIYLGNVFKIKNLKWEEMDKSMSTSNQGKVVCSTKQALEIIVKLKIPSQHRSPTLETSQPNNTNADTSQDPHDS